MIKFILRHFEEYDTKHYVVFQQMYKYFKRVSDVGSGNYIYFLKSEVLCDENIAAATAADYIFNPRLSYFGTKTRVEFSESCLKQDKVTYDHGKVVNIYNVFEISKILNISSYSALEKFLFAAVSLTKDADIGKYNYSGYVWYWI